MSYYECEHGRDIGRCQECADEKDNRAEITRLNAALSRVRGQRDKAMINYFWMRKAHYEESIEALDAIMAREYGSRIIGGTVEEIES